MSKTDSKNKSPVIVSESLLSQNYQSLLWTSWLTALNDNVFRWVAIGIGRDFFDPKDQNYVLMAGTAVFLLPWILLAGPAGYLADRFRKRNVIVVCKVIEVIVMAVGAFAIYIENFPLLITMVGLMGAQSALFAPAKIGTIPEMMGPDRISNANGFMNLASLSATILGVVVAGVICDSTGFKGTETHTWLPAAILVGVAVAGVVVSLPMKAYQAQNPRLRFSFNLFGRLIQDQKQLYKNGPLFRVAVGIVIFWSIALLGQLNVDQFAEESGKLIESHRTPLLVSLVLGVGFGSVLAGFMSAGRIELGMVPWGAMGIVAFCVALFFTPPDFIDSSGLNGRLVFACTALACLGISAGFFNIPLVAYIQHKSPTESRGAILAALNCLTFAGMMVTALLYYGLRAPVRNGAFENIPEKYRLESLNSEQQKQVAQKLIDFDQLDKKDTGRFANEIEDEPIRNVVTSIIVWNELKEGPGDSGLEMKQYIERFEYYESRRAAKAAFVQTEPQPLFTSRQVFLVMGLFAVPLFAYSAYRLRHAMARFFMWRLAKILYRIEVKGIENIPENGGAVLVCNHVSWLDGALMLMMTSRTTRMLAWAGNFKSPFMRWVAHFTRTILMTTGPKSIQSALAQSRKALGRGELVGIFPEGGLSRTGGLQTFKPGLMRVLEKTPVPIVPVYIDEMFGGNLTFANDKSIFRIPSKLRRQITINIGKPFERPEKMFFVRQKVQQLGAEAVDERQSPFLSPVQKFIRSAKRRRGQLKVGCSTNQQANGGSLLMRALILRRLLSNHILDDLNAEKNVGVLIPPSFGGVATNLALALDRRVAVNLNYTVSSEILNECIKQAGIKRVLTSKKIWEKFDYELDAEIVFLDDLREKVTTFDKIAGAIGSYVTPAGMLEKSLGLNQVDPNEVLTIIFTSGSTGNPKGVLLTHKNVATNVDAIEQVVNLTSNDVIVGVLPFFHSFGYTVTLWGSMGLDLAGIYHFNPLDAKQVGKLTRKYGGTVILGTPTFLRTYVRRVDKEDFKTLDTVVAGAEKLPKELCDAFERKFGIRPVEGYGATELSPLVSVNVPPSRTRKNFQVDCKEGTVGRPIPNVAAKVTDLDDDSSELGPNESGMLWITGPNVMRGYLNKPEATAEVVQDGWYKTGDVALIDDDGFIQITGRISRFSKIGGEMVPHVKVEEILNAIVGEDVDDDGEIDEMKMAVTSVPDAKKGERLIVLHTEIKQAIDDLRKRLSEEGLPNIFIPSADSFIQIEELPMLGTGKLDLKKLKMTAEELVSASTSK